ncbi:MAG: nucleotidyltransferase domain-containing protein [Balneolaceae bacterium]|nr:nucleotidyltransferase domain-containing protein [Balneolaceae bacterium]
MNHKNRNRFGLTDRDMRTIQAIFQTYPAVESVHIFGSRAKGNHRIGSDLDLAIMNKGVSSKQIASIRGDFEQSSLPYNVDLVDFNRIDKKEFTDHIKRVGVPFFKQNREIPTV